MANLLGGIIGDNISLLGVGGNKILATSEFSHLIGIDADGSPGSVVVRDSSGDSTFNNITVGNVLHNQR